MYIIIIQLRSLKLRQNIKNAQTYYFIQINQYVSLCLLSNFIKLEFKRQKSYFPKLHFF